MKKILVCFLCIATVFLSACTNNNGQSITSENIDITNGGTLNIYSSYPDTFNPLITKEWANRQMLSIVYEGLFKVNTDKTVLGVLAKDYKVENNGKRYVINLKENVLFHNGSKFDAYDVIYTLDCIREHSDNYKELVEKISSYTTNGNYQVIIDLNDLVLNFPVYLSFPILCSDYKTEGDKQAFFDLNSNVIPCGTGAFMVKKDSFTQNTITLEKNPSWHLEGPYVDEINVTFMKDNATVLYSFNACQTDIISSDIVKWGEFSFSNKMNTAEYSSQYYSFLAFNFSAPTLSDAEIRKAIMHAVDKERLVNDVMHGHAYAVDVPVNPNAYYNPVKFESKYNENTAKELLAKNNWTDLNSDFSLDKIIDGEMVSLEYKLLVRSDDKEDVATANIIKDALGKCLIKTEIVLKDGEEYFNALKSGEFDMAIVRYEMPKNDDLTNLLSIGGIHNFYNLEHTDIDSTSGKIKFSQKSEDIKNAFSVFSNVFSVSLPHIPLYYSTYTVYYQNYLKNYTAPSLDSIYSGISNIYIKY